jgi:uncharacterized repeat protein (TIGR03943 family)
MRAAALLAWGAFLTWLWLGGRAATYIGPRTAWVVPFGAIALLGCGIACLALVRTVRADWWGGVLLVSPIVAVLATPSPQLGAYAAHRKAPLVQVQLDRGHIDRAKPITLTEIVAGNVDEDTRTQVGAHEGRAAKVSGIVTKAARGRIDVTRFRIWCCAADATPFTVTVRTAKRFKLNQWVAVKGSLRDSGGHIYEVMASDVHRAPKPADPYL